MNRPLFVGYDQSFRQNEAAFWCIVTTITKIPETHAEARQALRFSVLPARHAGGFRWFRYNYVQVPFQYCLQKRGGILPEKLGGVKILSELLGDSYIS